MDYILDARTERFVRLLDAGIVRHSVLTGAPGTGKTALTAWYAERRGATYLYFLCHPWMTEEDLFNVLDVAALAAGIEDKQEGWQPGILRQAAQASQQGMVVLCFDEIDKVSSKVEVLLLDFLQNGRVPLPDHSLLQAQQKNMIVFLTSNATRPLSDALLRRVYRFRMDFLPASVELGLLRQATGAPMSLIKAVNRLTNILRADESASKPSLAEQTLLLQCLLAAPSSRESVRDDVIATLCKSDEDVRLLDKAARGWDALLNGLILESQYKEIIRR
jgi:MoxR-like ATPase